MPAITPTEATPTPSVVQAREAAPPQRQERQRQPRSERNKKFRARHKAEREQKRAAREARRAEHKARKQELRDRATYYSREYHQTRQAELRGRGTRWGNLRAIGRDFAEKIAGYHRANRLYRAMRKYGSEIGVDPVLSSQFVQEAARVAKFIPGRGISREAVTSSQAATTVQREMQSRLGLTDSQVRSPAYEAIRTTVERQGRLLFDAGFGRDVLAPVITQIRSRTTEGNPMTPEEVQQIVRQQLQTAAEQNPELRNSPLYREFCDPKATDPQEIARTVQGIGVVVTELAAMQPTDIQANMRALDTYIASREGIYQGLHRLYRSNARWQYFAYGRAAVGVAAGMALGFNPLVIGGSLGGIGISALIGAYSNRAAIRYDRAQYAIDHTMGNREGKKVSRSMPSMLLNIAANLREGRKAKKENRAREEVDIRLWGDVDITQDLDEATIKKAAAVRGALNAASGGAAAFGFGQLLHPIAEHFFSSPHDSLKALSQGGVPGKHGGLMASVGRISDVQTRPSGVTEANIPQGDILANIAHGGPSLTEGQQHWNDLGQYLGSAGSEARSAVGSLTSAAGDALHGNTGGAFAEAALAAQHAIHGAGDVFGAGGNLGHAFAESLRDQVDNHLPNGSEPIHSGFSEHPYTEVGKNSHGNYVLEFGDGKASHSVEISAKELNDQGLQLVNLGHGHGIAIASMSDPLRIYAYDFHIDSQSFLPGSHGVGIDAHWAVPLDKITNAHDYPAMFGEHAVKGDVQLGHATMQGGHLQFHLNHPAEWGPKAGWVNDTHEYANADAYLHSLPHIVQDPRLPFAMELNNNTDFVVQGNYGLFVSSDNHEVWAAINMDKLQSMVPDVHALNGNPDALSVKEIEIQYLAANKHVSLGSFSASDLKDATHASWSANSINPKEDGFPADYATKIGEGSNIGHGPFSGGKGDYFYNQGTPSQIYGDHNYGLNPNEVDGLQHVMNFTGLQNIPPVANPPAFGLLPEVGDLIGHGWPILAAAYVAGGGLAGFIRERQGKNYWPASRLGKFRIAALTIPHVGGFFLSRAIPHKAGGAGKPPKVKTPKAKKGKAPTTPPGTPVQAPYLGTPALVTVPLGVAPGGKLNKANAATAATEVTAAGGKGVDGKDVTPDQITAAHHDAQAAMGGKAPATMQEATEAAAKAANAVISRPKPEQLDLTNRANADLLAAMIVPEGSSISREYVADQIQRVALAGKGISDTTDPNSTSYGKGLAESGLDAIKGAEPSGEKGENNPAVAFRQVTALRSALGTRANTREILDAFRASGYSDASLAVIAAELHTPASGLSAIGEAQSRIKAGFTEVFGTKAPTTDELLAVAKEIDKATTGVTGNDHFGRTDQERRENIYAVVDANAGVITVAQRARLRAEMTLGDARTRVAEALNFYSRELAAKPPRATAQDLAEIEKELRLVQPPIQQSIITDEERIRGLNVSGAQAADAKARANNNGSKPKEEVMEDAIRTELTPDPVKTRLKPEEIGEALALMRTSLGASDDEIRAVVEKLKLTPSERANVAKEMLLRLTENGTKQPTADIIRTVIAAAGLQKQTGQPTLTVGEDTTLTIVALGYELNEYNQGNKGSAPSTANQISDPAQMLATELDLSIDNRKIIAEEIIKANKVNTAGAQIPPEHRLSDVFRIAISPTASAEEIGKVMEAVQSSADWGGAQIGKTELETLLDPKVLNITDVEKQAVIYGRFIESGGTNTPAERAKATTAALLSGTPDGARIINVVQGLRKSGATDQEVMTAMQSVSRTTTAIVSAVNATSLDDKEKAKVAVIASAPAHNYDACKEVYSDLHNFGIKDDDIQEAMRLLKITDVERITMINRHLEVSRGRIPKPRKDKKTGNILDASQKEMTEKTTEILREAFIISGAPKIIDMGTEFTQIINKVEKDLLIDAIVGGVTLPALPSEVVDGAINEIKKSL